MFDHDAYIFELPVYSIPEDLYYDKFDAYKAQLVDRLSTGGGDRESHQRLIDSQSSMLLKEFWGSWRYNQAVGFVGVLPLGCQLRGEVWLSAAKRIERRLKDRRIEHRSKGFEMTVRPAETSPEILSRLLEQLRYLSQGKLLKRRYLDLRQIRTLGQFIDWRSLLDKSTELGAVGFRREIEYP